MFELAGRNNVEKIHASNRFRDNTGLYLAVVIDGEEGAPAKVVATNPIVDNAIYLVDESTTKVNPETGVNFTWKEVLVGGDRPKQLALARGAVRKYHRNDYNSRVVDHLDIA